MASPGEYRLSQRSPFTPAMFDLNQTGGVVDHNGDLLVDGQKASLRIRGDALVVTVDGHPLPWRDFINFLRRRA